MVNRTYMSAIQNFVPQKYAKIDILNVCDIDIDSIDC